MNMTTETLKNVVKTLYTGHTDINIENVQVSLLSIMIHKCLWFPCLFIPMSIYLIYLQDLLEASNYLQAKELNNKCIEFMIRNLDVSNCVAVLKLADQLTLERLLQEQCVLKLWFYQIKLQIIFLSITVFFFVKVWLFSDTLTRKVSTSLVTIFSFCLSRVMSLSSYQLNYLPSASKVTGSFFTPDLAQFCQPFRGRRLWWGWLSSMLSSPTTLLELRTPGHCSET